MGRKNTLTSQEGRKRAKALETKIYPDQEKATKLLEEKRLNYRAKSSVCRVTTHRPDDVPIIVDQTSQEGAFQLSQSNEAIPELDAGLIDPQLLNNLNDNHERSVSGKTECQSRKILPLAVDQVNKPNRYDVGSMDNLCGQCNALHFKLEKTASHFLNCCNDGKLILASLSFPDELKEYYSLTTKKSQLFLKHILIYNGALSFASFNAANCPPPGSGPPVVRIHGVPYHMLSALHGKDGAKEAYGQLYMFDPAVASYKRSDKQENQRCDEQIMLDLSVLLARINPYANLYRTIAELENNQGGLRNIQMSIKEPLTNDIRRYNLPTTDHDIAAVFVSLDGYVPQKREIVLQSTDDKLIRISTLSPFCDPLTYALLFPNGDYGFSLNLRQAKNQEKKITELQYAQYKLAVRNEFSVLHRAGKLSQQYWIDLYTRVEGDRLNWIRHHQKDLRVELYCGLMDHLATNAAAQKLRGGKLCILPSSFPGSPRWMNEHRQDAMQLVVKFGKPDLFITFTCNPKCPEIVNSLLPGQLPHDRPDIVTRVFRLHVKELMKQLTKKNIFGKIDCFISVIEFQKRGLPHLHLLLTLGKEDKIITSNQIDRVVCAYIVERGSIFERP